MKTVELSLTDYEKLKSEAKRTFPVEACAILFGEKVDSRYIVKLVVHTKNELNSAVRFEIDPQGFYYAVKEAEEMGLEFLGFFHSHHADPNPSHTDLKFMGLWEGTVWLIFSTMNSSLGAYMMVGGKTENLEVKIL